MSALPKTLFVNLYEGGVGGCVGSAYVDRGTAETHACSNRIAMVELPTSFGSRVLVPEDIGARLRAFATDNHADPSQVLTEALAIYFAMPREVRTAARRYAAEQRTTLAVVMAEAARKYFMPPEAA